MIVELLEKYSWLVGILALIGVELAPIKVNPLTLIGKLLGRLTGVHHITEKINALEHKMLELHTNLDKDMLILNNKIDTNEVDRIRYEILAFGGDIRHGLSKTEAEYNHIEDLYKKYKEDLHANSYIDHEMEFIRDCKDKGRSDEEYGRIR